jgi:hypothetical protein
LTLSVPDTIYCDASRAPVSVARPDPWLSGPVRHSFPNSIQAEPQWPDSNYGCRANSCHRNERDTTSDLKNSCTISSK